MAGDIAIQVEGGLATLRLRNPERRNAISAAMWQSIREFAESAAGRADVRVVLIRGDGDIAFSSGADIAGFDEARSGIVECQELRRSGGRYLPARSKPSRSRPSR